MPCKAEKKTQFGSSVNPTEEIFSFVVEVLSVFLYNKFIKGSLLTFKKEVVV